MGLGSFYFKLIKREYYKDISLGLLILNWIVQRIFRVNSKVPFSVHYTSRINGAQNLITHGTKAKISLAVSGGCYFSCHSGTITIGKGTIIANNVTVVANNHQNRDRNKYISKPVIIGDNCWIGAGSVILPGVIIGNNVTIGANSTVTKSFKDNLIIAGNPAKEIKKI